MPNSNTQMIQKGKISSIEGEPDRNGDKTTARVVRFQTDHDLDPDGDAGPKTLTKLAEAAG